MRLYLIAGFTGALVLTSVVWGWHFIIPPKEIIVTPGDAAREEKKSAKTKEELIAEAMEKSSNAKGLYMTADVANDQGAGATRLRKKLIELAERTEINAFVIDVKEVCGPDYDEGHLKQLLDELHQKNIWAIARIVAFKDASQIEVHPEWYLKRKIYKAVGDQCFNKRYLRAKVTGKKPDTTFWQDDRGGYWLDPASEGAREYLLSVSKKMITLGFDELQFDYVRFPSDGDVNRAEYPVWDGKTPKDRIMKSFFEFLHRGLKSYKPDIILSVDLFGYVAIRAGDVGIGQRLDDIGDNFDYISFMVYPSHYYSGLYLPADPLLKLPAVGLNRVQARAHPDIIVGRSLLFAREFLDGKLGTTTGEVDQLSARSRFGKNGEAAISPTSTISSSASGSPTLPRSYVRLRPWLEDFFHDQDREAGRPFGAEKVRLQIDAAEKVEPHGWLLWNASNVYTEGALKEEK